MATLNGVVVGIVVIEREVDLQLQWLQKTCRSLKGLPFLCSFEMYFGRDI
mgnify:CR=1 FL=1